MKCQDFVSMKTNKIYIKVSPVAGGVGALRVNNVGGIFIQNVPCTMQEKELLV